jgi:ADP-ribose pyrophosphatase YjhB (NUDIX family)
VGGNASQPNPLLFCLVLMRYNTGMKKWKIIKSQEIFSHPRLTLIEDDVVLPNGVETKYLKFKHTGNAVTVMYRRDDGKFIVQKEYSHPPEEWLYQFPGGFVPDGEDLEDGANREFMEEAKLWAGKLELIGSYLLNNRRSASRMYVYLATEIEERGMDGDVEEDIETYWFSDKEIDELIRKGEIVNGHMLASWSLYKLRNVR